MEKTRLIIYVADICAMTGKTERGARRLMTKIRHQYSKSHRDQFVSVGEFSAYTGISEMEIKSYLSAGK